VPYRVVISRAARDPTAAFDIRISDDGLREAIFAGGRGFLDFRVLEEQDLIAVLNVTWLG
jgi:hypothetical protein